MGAPHRLAVGGSLEHQYGLRGTNALLGFKLAFDQSDDNNHENLRMLRRVLMGIAGLVEAEPPPEALTIACNRVVSSLGGRWDLAALSRLLTKAAVAERLERAGSKRLPLLTNITR